MSPNFLFRPILKDRMALTSKICSVFFQKKYDALTVPIVLLTDLSSVLLKYFAALDLPDQPNFAKTVTEHCTVWPQMLNKEKPFKRSFFFQIKKKQLHTMNPVLPSTKIVHTVPLHYIICLPELKQKKNFKRLRHPMNHCMGVTVRLYLPCNCINIFLLSRAKSRNILNDFS